ncbi:DNA sulfur modification protein DndB [Vibrio astriarenae]
MTKKNVVTLKGVSVLSSASGRGAKSIHCTLPLSQAVKSCCLPDELEGVQSLTLDMSRPINVAQVENVQRLLLDSVGDTSLTPLLSMTLVVEGSVNEMNDDRLGLISITYSSQKAYIVQGIQLLAAYGAFTKSEPSITKSALLGIQPSPSEKVLAQIARLPISVNVIYRNNTKISQREIVSLLHSYNKLDTRVHSVSLEVYNEATHPIMLAVEEIAKEINLEKFGGMSTSSRLTKSDSFITTQSSMAGLVLAAIGGKSARLTTPLPRKLPNKKEITKELINERQQSIVTFLKAWLETVEYQFENTNDNFHSSPQVWQALGLVIHHLHETCATGSAREAGFMLGSLEYDKSAKHWSQCSALKLDATGKYYINATGGGRSLRDGVARYFISLLSDVTN